MKKLFPAFALRCAIAAAAMAIPGVIPAQDGRTDVTRKIGIEQKLGVQLPLDLNFRDEAGRQVKLREFFDQGRPVVIVPVFYGCQGVCLMIRDGLLKVVNAQKKVKAAQNFEVVVFSVHPKETPTMAAEAKKFWVENYKYPGTENSWHFLVGDWTNIQALTSAIGFKFTYDAETDAINHPAALIVATEDGVVSHYLTGATYSALDFKQAVELAAQAKVGKESPTILLGCMKYDPATGKYRVVVENVLKVLGIGTVLLLAASIAFMSVKYRQRSAPSQGVGRPSGA